MSSERPRRGRSPALRAFLHDLRRTVRARRRPLAALCAAVAVTAALQVVRPPAPETVPVLVAAHDLDAGTTLAGDDVTVAERRPEALPVHSYDAAGDATGRTVAAPMRAGEAVTDLRLVHPGLLDGYPDGSALSAVRVADRAALTGLRVGDEVNVIGVDPRGRREPEVIARRARVVALPEPGPDAGHDAGQDAVVLVAVPQDVALELADAAVTTRLSVVSVL
ncbi:MAG: SAF domain-containing protein [Nocardioidaceae bacterium]